MRMANPISSRAVLMRCLMATPTVTPSIPGMPTSAAADQSTLPSAPWAIVPHIAIRMIAARDVDVARLAS